MDSTNPCPTCGSTNRLMVKSADETFRITLAGIPFRHTVEGVWFDTCAECEHDSVTEVSELLIERARAQAMVKVEKWMRAAIKTIDGLKSKKSRRWLMAKKVKELKPVKAWSLAMGGEIVQPLEVWNAKRQVDAVKMRGEKSVRVLVIEDTPANRKRLGVKP